MSFKQEKINKVGLALGSGAARGLAHIGILKVFEEEGIPVDMIAGTSMGALIGALFAAGVPPRHMEEVARNVDWRRMARLVDPIIPTSGILDGKKVSHFFSELLPVHTFDQLKIPLSILATDVETGDSLVIRKGDLLEALKAAIAFPGIFTPVRFGERFLLDGGLCNPVPVDVVRQQGADVTIGVCTIPEVDKRQKETFLPAKGTQGVSAEGMNSQRIESLFRKIWPRSDAELEGRTGIPEIQASTPPERRPPGILRIFTQSIAIMENRINDLQLRYNRCDLLLRPDLNGITLLEFHRAAEAIRAGEESARVHLGEIRHLIDL